MLLQSMRHTKSGAEIKMKIDINAKANNNN